MCAGMSLGSASPVDNLHTLSLHNVNISLHGVNMKEALARRKAMFVAEGVSVREWALKHGFNPRTVYAVLNGELKCRRGIGHHIAVELGVKAKPPITPAPLVVAA